MKCPNCSSPMFVSDETSSPKCRITYYRCSVCSREHLSSAPVIENQPVEAAAGSIQPAHAGKAPLMV